MKVYILKKDANGNLIPVPDTNLDDILSYKGTAIRITGEKGIRMITSIPTEKKNKLIYEGYDGYKVMEYGTLVCWVEDKDNPTNTIPLLIKKDNGEFESANGVARSPAFSREKNIFLTYSEGNGTTIYTSVLVEQEGKSWTDANCATDFALRPYMILRPKDANDNSQDVVLYGGTLYRSISYVAYQSRNDKNKGVVKGTDAYEYVWKLIRAGYGDKYDSEYEN